VVLVGPAQATDLAFGDADVKNIPAELVERLETSPGTAYAYADVPVGKRVEPGLVVGTTLSVPGAGPYRLYQMYSLAAEQETFSLVRRTAAAAGLLLVGLLALITSLVARQVVAPVRAAASTAERLAAGRLDERMRVRGEDEFARLGSTFNSMAEALQTQIQQLEDLSRVQRRFVSDVSHELRTPLTTVRMAADVLYDARADFPGPAERAAELMQGEIDRFEAMLVDLLEISRYDAGAAELDASAPWSAAWCRPPSRWPSTRAAGSTSSCPPGRWSPTSRRRGSSGCCATWWSTPSSTARAGRSRCA
jgi:two-component system sensor histidine kinase MtrB